MKKLITILTLITLMACSKEDGCNCTKDTYRKSTIGLDFTLLYSEPVLCQNESDGWQGTGVATIFFKIQCD